VTWPVHVNVNTIGLMPTCQAFAVLAVDRAKEEKIPFV